MAIILEQYNRVNKQINYYRINSDSQSISLGRGYNNDVILSDNYVSPNHAVIKLDDEEQWVIVDQQSINGITVNKRKVINPQALNSGDVINLGNNRFRFILAMHEVAETKKFGMLDKLIDTLSQPFVMILLTAFSLAIFTLNEYLTDFRLITWDRLLFGVLPVLGIVLSWTSIYSIIAKLFRGYPQFFLQTSISLFIIASLILLGYVMDILFFNLKSGSYANDFKEIYLFFMLFVLLLVSSYVAYQMSFKKRFLINIIIVMIVFGFNKLYDYTKKDDLEFYARYNGQIEHKDLFFRQSVSIDNFIEKAEDIF